MENAGALVSTPGPKNAVALDLLRSRGFAERALRDLGIRKTILHVDGHGFTRKVLKSRVSPHLADWDVGFVPQASPEEALAFLSESPVDLILSSSLVECRKAAGPAEAGSFLCACKRLFPSTPFVLYTARGTVDNDVSSADAVLFKNSDFSELVGTLRRLLRAPCVH